MLGEKFRFGLPDSGGSERSQTVYYLKQCATLFSSGKIFISSKVDFLHFFRSAGMLRIFWTLSSAVACSEVSVTLSKMPRCEQIQEGFTGVGSGVGVYKCGIFFIENSPENESGKMTNFGAFF